MDKFELGWSVGVMGSSLAVLVVLAVCKEVTWATPAALYGCALVPIGIAVWRRLRS